MKLSGFLSRFWWTVAGIPAVLVVASITVAFLRSGDSAHKDTRNAQIHNRGNFWSSPAGDKRMGFADREKRHESAARTSPPLLSQSPESPFAFAKLRGIQDRCQAPASPDLFIQINCWGDVVGNEFVDVVAGAEGPAGDDSQGTLLVSRLTPEGLVSGRAFYQTPTKDGPVKVVSVNGPRLTLSTEQGRQYMFDLNRDKYI